MGLSRHDHSADFLCGINYCVAGPLSLGDVVDQMTFTFENARSHERRIRELEQKVARLEAQMEKQPESEECEH